MPKRKATDADGDTGMTNPDANDDSDSDSDSDLDILNVDFEWFDPQPTHDFHGLKTLLTQLFGPDSPLLPLSALTNLILSQPLLGSTVKTDGNTGDPYAFLTVLNLTQRVNDAEYAADVKALINYLLSKADGKVKERMQALLKGDGGDLGLILTDRLLNMPGEITPPMYRMLLEEVQWAVDDKEAYDFGAYLIVSKTYTEVKSALDEEDERPFKKGKKGKRKMGEKGEVFYFHPEDEVVVKMAGEEGVSGYAFTNKGEAADSKRVFSEMGIDARGVMMMVGKGELEGVVEGMERLYGGGQ